MLGAVVESPEWETRSPCWNVGTLPQPCFLPRRFGRRTRCPVELGSGPLWGPTENGARQHGAGPAPLPGLRLFLHGEPLRGALRPPPPLRGRPGAAPQGLRAGLKPTRLPKRGRVPSGDPRDRERSAEKKGVKLSFERKEGNHLPELQAKASPALCFTDKRIYRLPVFAKEFCQAFIEELENFEQSEMPKGRPNSMNNYGVLLNELGMDEGFITPLREKYLQPLTALLYPDCGGGRLDSHKAFVVKYALHEDLDLSSHYDNAEVTINVSLGKEFTEGNLYFAEFRQDANPVPKYVEVEHVPFHGLFHRGGQMHGALPITSGERWNLIIWMRSSAVRNQLCPMCNRKPELVEAEGFGEGFTCDSDDRQPETVNVCSLT